MFQQTSLLAYNDIRKIGMKQRACYDIINIYGPVCNQEIGQRLGWEINRVTPRVKELREQGLVEEAYRGINPETNRKVIYWGVK